MANRSRVITMSPLVLNQEDDLEVDLDLWEVVNPSDGEYSDDSFSVDSLSDDDVISLDDAPFVSPPVIMPPQMLTKTDSDDRAADLDLDRHGDGDGDGVNDGDGDGVNDGDAVLRDEVVDNDLGWTQRRMVVLRGGTPYSLGIVLGNYANRGGYYDNGDDDRGVDDGEYEDTYDLDDELVPRSVTAKLERQRMRKLGKRGIAKVLTSKKYPYSHLKPGCVRGKHGLGMKFRY